MLALTVAVAAVCRSPTPVAKAKVLHSAGAMDVEATLAAYCSIAAYLLVSLCPHQQRQHEAKSGLTGLRTSKDIFQRQRPNPDLASVGPHVSEASACSSLGLQEGFLSSPSKRSSQPSWLGAQVVAAARRVAGIVI